MTKRKMTLRVVMAARWVVSMILEGFTPAKLPLLRVVKASDKAVHLGSQYAGSGVPWHGRLVSQVSAVARDPSFGDYPAA